MNTKQARNQGRAAAAAGQAETTNPFKPGTPERKAWFAAFRSAPVTPVTAPVTPVVTAPVTPVPPAPVTPVVPPVKAKASKAKANGSNPFRSESIAFNVTCRLQKGVPITLTALFEGTGSRDPLAILQDIRRKGIGVTFNPETKTYSV